METLVALIADAYYNNVINKLHTHSMALQILAKPIFSKNKTQAKISNFKALYQQLFVNGHY